MGKGLSLKKLKEMHFYIKWANNTKKKKARRKLLLKAIKVYFN
ncbi:MAG: hypothetical protein ACRCX2_37485 [Paraclostridium sp.]